MRVYECARDVPMLAHEDMCSIGTPGSLLGKIGSELYFLCVCNIVCTSLLL